MNDEQKYRVATWGLDILIPATIYFYTIAKMPTGFASYIRLGPVVLHAYTLLTLLIAYMIASHRLRNLSIPWRELCACAMVVVGIHLYDVLWGFASVMARGSGFPWVPLLSLSATMVLIWWLDTRLVFLKVTRWSICLIVVGVCAFAAMVATGWYTQMTLYETIGGADPSNLLWLVGKFTVVVGAAFLTDLQPETRVINVGAPF